MVTAAQRRRAVDHLKRRRVSERRACRLTGFSRSAAWYQPKGRDDGELRAHLRTLAERYPRYGCPTLHDMLRTERLVRNHKRTYRIYREEGLQVRTKRRKKLNRPRMSMPVPNTMNERWSLDFVSDQLANGRRFRVLTSWMTFRASAYCKWSTSRSPVNVWHVNSTGWLNAERYRKPLSATTVPN